MPEFNNGVWDFLSLKMYWKPLSLLYKHYILYTYTYKAVLYVHWLYNFSPLYNVYVIIIYFSMTYVNNYYTIFIYILFKTCVWLAVTGRVLFSFHDKKEFLCVLRKTLRPRSRPLTLGNTKLINVLRQVHIFKPTTHQTGKKTTFKKTHKVSNLYIHN